MTSEITLNNQMSIGKLGGQAQSCGKLGGQAQSCGKLGGQAQLCGIGIDLGTCNSCVSLYDGNTQTVVLDDTGNSIIPTSVLFLEDEILYGETANIKGVTYPKNLIKDIKRIIGKTTLKEVEYYNKQHCYDIIETENNINIRITHSNYTITITPDEIMGLYFSYLRQQINKYISFPPNEHINAVVTIPAYFTENQRIATIKAAQIAKINVIRLINEPTAAALTYLQEVKLKELDKNSENSENLIIFDIGGGTLDVTLLNINSNNNTEDCKDNLIQVIGTSGDSNLGGNDFNKEIMLYVLKEIKRNNPDLQLTNVIQNPKAIHKILKACEISKIELSKTINSNIFIEALEGKDYNVIITRSVLDNLCSKYFDKCIKLINQVIDDSHLKIEDIKDIILVGGPSSMPQLSNLITNKFGIEPKTLNNPKYSVCLGASIHCYTLINKYYNIQKSSNVNKYNELLIVDVTPLKIGVAVSSMDNKEMCTIIDKNTRIPCTATKIFSTEIDNQRIVTIKIYQGNSDFVKYNELIGKLRLTNIPAMLKRIPKIQVKFSLDCSGTLTVTAKELVSGMSVTAIFDNKKYNIPEYDNFTNTDDLLTFRACYLKKNINDYIASMNKYLTDDQYCDCINKEQKIKLIELLNSLKLKTDEVILNDADSIKTATDIYDIHKKYITEIINNPNLNVPDYV